MDAPTATTILGAAKLTGKTSGRWSMGLLQAITGEETARTNSAGLGARTVVEPLTSYTVARVQREVGNRTGLGLPLATSVSRQLNTQAARDGLSSRQPLLEALPLDQRGGPLQLGRDPGGEDVEGGAVLLGPDPVSAGQHGQRPDDVDAVGTGDRGLQP